MHNYRYQMSMELRGHKKASPNGMSSTLLFSFQIFYNCDQMCLSQLFLFIRCCIQQLYYYCCRHHRHFIISTQHTYYIAERNALASVSFVGNVFFVLSVAHYFINHFHNTGNKYVKIALGSWQQYDYLNISVGI